MHRSVACDYSTLDVPMDSHLIALEIVTAFSDTGEPYGAPYIIRIPRSYLLKSAQILKDLLSRAGYRYDWIDLTVVNSDKATLIIGQVNSPEELLISQEMEKETAGKLDPAFAAAQVLHRRYKR